MWQALLAAALLGVQDSRIPFEPGLTLTWAASLPDEPDWETRLAVVALDSAAATVQSSWNRRSREGKVRWHRLQHEILDLDRRLARSFHVRVQEGDAPKDPGSTFQMTSRAILDELKLLGKSSVLFLERGQSPAPYTGVLERAAAPESLEVLVNGRPVRLPGIRARGALTNPTAPQPELRMSLLFLDDPATPWILEVEARTPAAGTGRRQLVRISYPTGRPELETELAQRCRVNVYDIYFATASAELDSASAPTVGRIAEALGDHPNWQVTIVGHTDSIGGSDYNLDLSRRRAERVRTALVTNHGVGGTRLRADGRGESQPVEDNGTLTGRARNRRVELARACK